MIACNCCERWTYLSGCPSPRGGKAVRPVKDEATLREARPGAVEKNIEARRRVIASKLLKTGTALLVIGRSHDLTPHLGDVLYVRVTVRSYPGE